MAVSLSKVNTRKAKRSERAQDVGQKAAMKNSSPLIAALVADLKPSSEAWSARGLAREGRSARRERSTTVGDVNLFWYEWTRCVAGGITQTKILALIAKWIELENSIFEFLEVNVQAALNEQTRSRYKT